MKNLIIFLMLLQISLSYSQVGIGTTDPNGALDINSSNDGLLIPRIALTAKNIATVQTPTVSEIIYNTATSGTAPNEVFPGFYFWNGTAWTELSYSNNVWNLLGNNETNPTTHFIGTTDDADLIFKRNNSIAGRIGIDGVSFGFNALLNDITHNNIAFGSNALRTNTTGIQNIAVGNNALRANVGNSRSLAVGNEAFLYADDRVDGRETFNTAIGHYALRGNDNSEGNTGRYNTAVGDEALFSNTSGQNNTVSGHRAMYNNTWGFSNVANGVYSLFRNTGGYFNTAIGSYSLYSNTSGIGNTAIGYGSFDLCSVCNYNTAIGINTLNEIVSGQNNTAIGYEALNSIFSGSNNIGLGYNANVPSSTGSNQVRIGNNFITYAGTQVAWSITSDKRWKSNIQNTNLGLEFIKKLRPVSYFRENDEFKKTEYGFIAQELEEAFNTSGGDSNGIITIDDEGMYSVRYNDLLAPIVKAIQELETQTQNLKEENKNLKNQLELTLRTLNDKIEILTNKIDNL
ncbi:tail fiber domain-containing protein [Flavobacterium azooxidireducens]|uniref:Tail fiber domain-containing protein n=1 Tax=Flavobacterium azooxidireducens TaxID=1871076 RepID=A0ABY4KA95_9FLAO|nr:tail fiber domain-containing protein [Flavobacterium azooxidireducens]UPQ77720.1 tail fiber domain-containing protein [Flavobacterium azooxidireducens]